VAQSIHCRTLSALILLAIVVPVSPALLPTRALPTVEAAEAELDTVAPGAAVPPGFAATRPAEGEIRVSLKPGRNVEEPWAFLPIATGEQQGIDSTTMPIPVYSPPDTPLLTAQPAGEYLFVAFGYEHRHGVMRYDGEGWAWVTDGLYLQDTIAVSQIAADPGNPTTLLLSTPNGIYRTTDALGRCYWDKVLAITGTTTIEAHPTVSGTFFAATVPLANCPGGGSCSRFYKSSDWGTTWSGPVKLSYVSTGDNPQEICVWVDPQGEDEDVVYIPNVNMGASGSQYFWRSIDAGDTFTKVRTLAFRPYGGCAVDPITDVVRGHFL